MSFGNYDYAIKDHTFHSAETSTGDGTAFDVESYSTLAIKTTGTSSSRTLNFYAVDADGNKTAILGTKVGTTTTATTSTAKDEYWVFDVRCINQVIINIGAISGGNMTIKGRASIN